LEKAGAVGVPLIGGSFDLTSADGAKFSNSDLLGKYYLLYFGFTHCPDICPEELVKISEITKRVKDIKADVPFVPVFITCDPERDSPDVIKSYLKGTIIFFIKTIYFIFIDFGNDFVGLTGEPNVIKNVAKSFRIYYRKTPTSADGDYLVDHSIFFYLMGPDGKFICNFGRESSVDSCTDKILEEMKKGENKPSQ
jgi:protein SCO1